MGSAGSVLAARTSMDSSYRVLRSLSSDFLAPTLTEPALSTPAGEKKSGNSSSSPQLSPLNTRGTLQSEGKQNAQSFLEKSRKVFDLDNYINWPIMLLYCLHLALGDVF